MPLIARCDEGGIYDLRGTVMHQLSDRVLSMRVYAGLLDCTCNNNQFLKMKLAFTERRQARDLGSLSRSDRGKSAEAEA